MDKRSAFKERILWWIGIACAANLSLVFLLGQGIIGNGLRTSGLLGFGTAAQSGCSYSVDVYTSSSSSLTSCHLAVGSGSSAITLTLPSTPTLGNVYDFLQVGTNVAGLTVSTNGVTQNGAGGPTSNITLLTGQYMRVSGDGTYYDITFPPSPDGNGIKQSCTNIGCQFQLNTAGVNAAVIQSQAQTLLPNVCTGFSWGAVQGTCTMTPPMGSISTSPAPTIIVIATNNMPVNAQINPGPAFKNIYRMDGVTQNMASDCLANIACPMTYSSVNGGSFTLWNK